MGLIDRFKRVSGPRPGTMHTGPAAFCADQGVVPWPGFYALTQDGKTLRTPLVRLVAVDDAPGDPRDGAWHLEVAGPGDPAQRNGVIVPLEVHATGRSQMGVGE